MTYENNPEYKRFLKDWQLYKEIEVNAKAVRIATEKAILRIIGNDLNEKGVNKFPANLEITTGMTASWDMDFVDRECVKFDNGTTNLPFFPFDRVWKPNNKKLTIIKETMPDVFREAFSEALTIKPKSPMFKIKD